MRFRILTGLRRQRYRPQLCVRQARPDFRLLAQLGSQGVIITAPGEGCDFVSRYFAPGVGLDEDPVTGSIHSARTPY
ncbi:MAG: PhzF family phenazine biosynthesis protein [Marinobacter sp.]